MSWKTERCRRETKDGQNTPITMPKRTWTRRDYIEAIGMNNRRKRSTPKRRRRALGTRHVLTGKHGKLLEAALLSKMIGSKKNRAQKMAVIDSLDNTQMKGMGNLFKMFMKTRYPLPNQKIKQLVRDKKFISSFIDHRIPVATRRLLLKQKGGILGAILPIAGRLIGSSILGPLLGKIFK